MISFKYHVEVVVDLGGKLAGLQRHVPGVSSVINVGNLSAARGDGNPNMLTAWGGNIVDTDHLRREKSVVACLFEVTVGTIDSARKRGGDNSSDTRQNNDGSLNSPATPVTAHEPLHEEAYVPEAEGIHQTDQRTPHPYYDQTYDVQYHDYYSHMGYDHHLEPHPEYTQPEYAQIPVPQPEIHATEGLSEKERIRRAEERLLPSQPPEDNPGPSLSWTVVGPPAPSAPSAPPLELQDDIYDADAETLQAVSASAAPSAVDMNASGASSTIPSAPALEDLAPNPGLHSTDDKQELERQRLMNEASAPSEFVADEDDNAGEGGSRPQYEPSAPILAEEGEYESRYSHHHLEERGLSSHQESLPKYER